MAAQRAGTKTVFRKLPAGNRKRLSMTRDAGREN
jgi:hypothetical protein